MMLVCRVKYKEGKVGLEYIFFVVVVHHHSSQYATQVMFMFDILVDNLKQLHPDLGNFLVQPGNASLCLGLYNKIPYIHKANLKYGSFASINILIFKCIRTEAKTGSGCLGTHFLISQGSLKVVCEAGGK